MRNEISSTKENPIDQHTESNILCIHSALLNFASVLDKMEIASDHLDKYITHERIRREDAFELYVIRILNYLCENANNNTENDTQLAITRDRLSKRYARYDISRAIGIIRFNNQHSIQ